jgi:hypothetical protein
MIILLQLNLAKLSFYTQLSLIYHIQVSFWPYHVANNYLSERTALTVHPSRVSLPHGFCPQLYNSNKIYQVAVKLLFVKPVGSFALSFIK